MLAGRVRVLTIAALLLLAAQYPAPVAGPLAPIGPWMLDYDETQCTATRKYGEPKSPLTLVIRPAPPGETYELLLGRNRAGPVYASQLEGSVDFGQGPINAWLLHYGSGGKKLDIYTYRITAREMSQARSASAVTMQIQGGSDVSLKLEAMRELLPGLERCTEDLKRYWNFDGEKVGTIAVPPRGDLRGLFTSDDYPDQALFGNNQGTAQFFLLINEKGAVAGCNIVEPSGAPVLDARGCEIIKERARFKPARDRNGKPVRSSATTPPVVWRIAD
jgi:hypothetical protein